jgi:hypothetical protein
MLAAPAASAQEGRVFIDPDSPAGTEYAIPLDEARREAAGGSATTRSAAPHEQPLFGTGIAPRGEGRPAGPEVSGSGSRRDGAKRGDEASSSGARTSSGSAAAVAASAGDGSSDTLLTLGLAGAVLAVGLVAGVAFRRTLGSG